MHPGLPLSPALTAAFLSGADFCQLSGMHLLVGRYLEAGAAGLRWRAAQLIGTCSQNVAAIQEQVLGLGALRKLLRLLDRDACDTVRVKALFAISCECPQCLGVGEGLGNAVPAGPAGPPRQREGSSFSFTAGAAGAAPGAGTSALCCGSQLTPPGGCGLVLVAAALLRLTALHPHLSPLCPCLGPVHSPQDLPVCHGVLSHVPGHHPV